MTFRHLNGQDDRDLRSRMQNNALLCQQYSVLMNGNVSIRICTLASRLLCSIFDAERGRPLDVGVLRELTQLVWQESGTNLEHAAHMLVFKTLLSLAQPFVREEDRDLVFEDRQRGNRAPIRWENPSQRMSPVADVLFSMRESPIRVKREEPDEESEIVVVVDDDHHGEILPSPLFQSYDNGSNYLPSSLITGSGRNKLGTDFKCHECNRHFISSRALHCHYTRAKCQDKTKQALNRQRSFPIQLKTQKKDADPIVRNAATLSMPSLTVDSNVDARMRKSLAVKKGWETRRRGLDANKSTVDSKADVNMRKSLASKKAWKTRRGSLDADMSTAEMFGRSSNDIDCPYCKEHQNFSNLDGHLLKNHANARESIFGCPSCDLWFLTVSGAKYHYNKKGCKAGCTVRSVEEAKASKQREIEMKTTRRSLRIGGTVEDNADANEKEIVKHELLAKNEASTGPNNLPSSPTQTSDEVVLPKSLVVQASMDPNNLSSSPPLMSDEVALPKSSYYQMETNAEVADTSKNSIDNDLQDTVHAMKNELIVDIET